jgi:hypothetical protein
MRYPFSAIFTILRVGLMGYSTHGLTPQSATDPSSTLTNFPTVFPHLEASGVRLTVSEPAVVGEGTCFGGDASSLSR